MDVNTLIDYFEEEEGYKTAHNEYGFFMYRINGNEMFIAHCAIKKAYRHCGLGYHLGKLAEDIAKENDCKKMVANIFHNPQSQNNFYKKLKVFIKFGFEVKRIYEGCVYVEKTLEV